MMLYWRFSCVCALLLLASCQWQETWHDVKETRFMLGTIVSFTVYSNDEQAARIAIQQAATTMQAVEQQFTTFGDVANSVQRFNHALAGETIRLTHQVDALLQQSIHIHQQTQGAFDPVLGALHHIWDFTNPQPNKQPPTQAVLQPYLAVSGVQNIQNLGAQQWLKKNTLTQLDFGAIAKGFAIDQGILSLKTSGIQHAIINAGGDLRIIGNHGQAPWKIAIRHPRSSTTMGWFEVQGDTSIVTSGDYERFFVYQNKRYHHILNPKTGQPAKHHMSVTIIAPTATLADAMSTAMFILDAQTGLSIIENSTDIEALWMNKNQQLTMSSGMKNRFLRNESH